MTEKETGGGKFIGGGGSRDRDQDGEAGGRKERKLLGSSHFRKKVCRFCTDADYATDYKNVRLLQTFMTEHGKLVPRRISGNCAHHQRKMTTEIKRARNLALIGFTNPGPFER